MTFQFFLEKPLNMEEYKMEGYIEFWNNLFNTLLQGFVPRVIAWTLMFASLWAILRRENPIMSFLFYAGAMFFAYIPVVSLYLS